MVSLVERLKRGAQETRAPIALILPAGLWRDFRNIEIGSLLIRVASRCPGHFYRASLSLMTSAGLDGLTARALLRSDRLEHATSMKRKASPEKLALIVSPECTVGMLEVFSRDPLLAEAVVQNPSWPPSILARLSFHSRGLQKLIVQNPNTPKALLLQLGEKHPKEFLQNPILWLITLEDPGFWSSAPEAFVEKILRRAEAPFEAICQALLTNLLTRHDPLLLLLARHPEAPAQALLQLAGCWQAHVRWAASKHPKLPNELVEVAQAEFLRADLKSSPP